MWWFLIYKKSNICFCREQNVIISSGLHWVFIHSASCMQKFQISAIHLLYCWTHKTKLILNQFMTNGQYLSHVCVYTYIDILMNSHWTILSSATVLLMIFAEILQDIYVLTRTCWFLDKIYKAICWWIMSCNMVLVSQLWFNGLCQLLAKFNTKEKTS